MFWRTWEQVIPTCFPWLVAAWMMGVFVLSLRLLLGLYRIRVWRRECRPVESAELRAIVLRYAARLGLRGSIQLVESARVAVPAVVGWLRPAILIPVSIMSGLTTRELESILAHELAHIRRHDYLVNLLQTIVETLLFYHPAVWWLSARIRAEREHCCDDIAIEVCGSRMALARALARMEELRCRPQPLMIASQGGVLVDRIRRIVGSQTRCTAGWWPAGVVAFGSMAALAVGLFLSATGVADLPSQREAGRSMPAEPSESVRSENADDDHIETRKQEHIRVDSKTGLNARVFDEIRLATVADDQWRRASLGMKYSNVFPYSLIPARVAKELNARELGEIDFGEAPPAAAPTIQIPFPLTIEKPGVDAGNPADNTITVAELTEPVSANQRIVPYANDPVWVPGHLALYGMNPKQQHTFRIVRIDTVALGVGPSFGPVNALVLDDDNSDFGLLGMDWVALVRGQQGEGLFYYPAESTFVYMALPQDLRPAPALPPFLVPDKSFSVESSGHADGLQRADRDGVRVLTTRRYNTSRRESTHWVPLGDARVPVDEGLEYDGVSIYLSLMWDIVAIDSQSGEVLWYLKWSKPQPFWHTVSVVEWGQGEGRQVAVELFAGNDRSGNVHYKYLALKSGAELTLPSDLTAQTLADIPLRIVEKDGDRIQRVELRATNRGRTPKQLLEKWESLEQHLERNVSVTEFETLVSADDDVRSFGNAVDATEIIFNLPEGSGLRAEFFGEQVEVVSNAGQTSVVVTGGRVHLLDQGGVIRAWASPDAGAEQLVADLQAHGGEFVMRLRAKRLVHDPNHVHNMQGVVFPDTGAPSDEEQSPHGAIRYEVEFDDPPKAFRFRMKWRYDVQRVREEALADGGEITFFAAPGIEPNSAPQRLAPPQVFQQSIDDQPMDGPPRIIDDRRPWRAQGRIVDANGAPLSGVEVIANCGIGTLRPTGKTVSDTTGHYVIDFGPGFWSDDPKLMQVATISARLPGYTERNLGRQGDCFAAMEQPNGGTDWEVREGNLILPGQPKEIDFVLIPAARLQGALYDQRGNRAIGYRISLTGRELPPSSNVIDQVQTDAHGEFTFDDIPPGFAFQLLVEPPRAESPWRAWASPPLVFIASSREDATTLEHASDGEAFELTFRRLHVTLAGDGENWRTALSEAATHILELTWEDGEVSGHHIRTAVASITLGK